MASAAATAEGMPARRPAGSGVCSGRPRTTGTSNPMPSNSNGMRPRNTHRHPTVSVTSPAIDGPTMAGNTHAAAFAA